MRNGQQQDLTLNMAQVAQEAEALVGQPPQDQAQAQPSAAEAPSPPPEPTPQ
jgi:hypothetical protein